MNILFIGNSFTYYNDLPDILKNIAHSAGYDIFTDKVAHGGFNLGKYADEQNPAGQEFTEKLNALKWDYVVLQEQSLLPVSDETSFFSSAKALIKRIRSAGAAPVLYQTWAYEKNSSKLDKTGLSYKKMYKKLKKAYDRLGADTKTPVCPVGTAFYKCSIIHPDIRLHDEKDNYHPTFDGSCLAAYVIFYKLFGNKAAPTFVCGSDRYKTEILRKTALKSVRRGRSAKSMFYNTITAVFAAAFLFSCYKVADYYIQAAKSASGFNRLYAIVSAAEDHSAENSKELTAAEKYGALKAENSDFAGWISISGTNISYPVMQSPDRPDYYLRRDFNGKYSYYGTPYAEEECDVGVSDNTVIYGHNMKNGTMFSALENYLSEDFFKAYRYIEFDTLSSFGRYEIVAVFKYDAAGSEFKYHEFVNAASQTDFDKYISECKRRSVYDTGTSAEYCDKLITLSTCEYSREKGRLAVVAKKI